MHSEPNRLGRSPGTDLSSPSVRLFFIPAPVSGYFVLPSFRFQYFLAVCDLFLISFPCSGRCCPLELLFPLLWYFVCWRLVTCSCSTYLLHPMYLSDGRVFLARPAPTMSCLRRRLLSLRPVVLAGCLAGLAKQRHTALICAIPPFCATGDQDWSGCRGGSPLVILMPGLRCCLPICLPASRGACYGLSMSCLSAPIGPVLVAADARPRRWSAGRRRGRCFPYSC